MQLTFLGNRYHAETVRTPSCPTPFSGKYRGVEFLAINTPVEPSATCQRKYRGVTY